MKEKPLDAFNSQRGVCKICRKIKDALRQKTPEYAEHLKGYRARPEVKERINANNRRYNNSAKGKARDLTHNQTAVRRIHRVRSKALRKLATAIFEERKESLRALIASYDVELERLKKTRRRDKSKP